MKVRFTRELSRVVNLKDQFGMVAGEIKTSLAKDVSHRP